MNWKTLLLMAIGIALFTCSCTRYITTYEAANGKAKCGRGLR